MFMKRVLPMGGRISAPPWRTPRTPRAPALRMPCQSAVRSPPESSWSRESSGKCLPVVFRNFPEQLRVFAPKRFETNHGAFQRQRQNNVQGDGEFHVFLSQTLDIIPCLSCISRRFQASLVRRRFARLFVCRVLLRDRMVLTSDDLTRPTIGHATRNAALLSGEPSVKAHCLPFSQIPHTTRLFADFLAYSPNIQPFYPKSPHFQEWMKEESGQISYDSSRRERVSAILERQNKSWNASPQTLANLDRLRKGAAAVVTGQQVGLFGGPMFAIYKALTAVKLAEEATAAGVDAVPIFWLATYDHDLAEVNHVSDSRTRGCSPCSHHAEPRRSGSARQCGASWGRDRSAGRRGGELARRFRRGSFFARIVSSRGILGHGFCPFLCSHLCRLGRDCARCFRRRTRSRRRADLSRRH